MNWNLSFCCVNVCGRAMDAKAMCEIFFVVRFSTVVGFEGFEGVYVVQFQWLSYLPLLYSLI